MTAQEHNKYVGWAQLGYAGFHVLMMIVSMGVMGVVFESFYRRSQEMGGPPAPPFLGLILVFACVINVAMTIPSVVAGYALLKRRPWARIAGIVGGVVAALSFPIGTAVAVYTFWFFFGDAGKQLYGGQNQALPPLPPKEWQPPKSDAAQPGRPSLTAPPDWR